MRIRRAVRDYARRQEGSAAAELALLAPMLVVLILVVVTVGKLTNASIDTRAAAHHAARAASLQRQPLQASRAANQAAVDTLSQRGIACTEIQATVDTTRFRAGGRVTVTVECRITLEQVSLLAIPGATTLSATATSPIDTFRE